MRNVPGSVTLVDDIQQDLKSEQMQDVTSSAYEEQNRINADFDEITGGFSTGSVSSNRQMNETVGGMELLKGDSNTVGEYQLRTFNETWVENVLRQVVLLEQAYETDENILAIVLDKQRLAKKYGIRKITDAMLQGRMNVRVNVGFGATQPEKRIQKVALGLNTVNTFLPHMAQRINGEEVINEIFGALGLDGERFYEGLGDDDYDQKFQQLMDTVKQLQQALESKQMEMETKKVIQQMIEQTKKEIAQMQEATKTGIAQMNAQLEYVDKQLMAEQNEIKRGQLYLQRQALVEQIKIKRLELLQDERNYIDGAAQAERDKQADTTGESSMTGSGKPSQTVQNDRYGDVPGAEG